MVQRVKHFGAELQIQPLGQFETFADPQIEIPITRSFKSVAPGSVASGRRYRKRTGVLENDGTDHSRDFLQLNLRFGSYDIRSRLMRKIRRADATAYTEGLSGHQRVNSVEA